MENLKFYNKYDFQSDKLDNKQLYLIIGFQN